VSIFRGILILAIPLFILFSCALKEGPSGGPEDTTKPSILGVQPQPGSTGIPVDTEFRILFSKPMNQDKTVNALFLSPVFWDYPEYRWKGKELIVVPPEMLAENKTYVLTIGAGATGHHGNQMGSSFSFAFSTGSVIDSGQIAGSIYLEKGRGTSYDIWAYSLKDTSSGAFLNDIPDYATQVDSLNEFEILNMAPGNYVVIAIDDKNDDLFWDPTSESIGLPPAVIELKIGAFFEGIVLRPERRDTIPAEISRIRPLDNRKIAVELSQPVLEKIRIDTTRFIIIASDSAALSLEGAHIGSEGRLILETAIQESEKDYSLKPVDMFSLWGIAFDTSGVRFTGSPDADTTGPELLSTIPSRGSRQNYQNDYIEMVFSERIKSLGFANAVSVVADSVDTLNIIPRWITPNKVHLTTAAGIPREREIEVFMDPPGIFDVHGNPMTDSALSFRFRIPPADTVGTVIISTRKSGNIIGELNPRGSSRGEVYFVHADNKGIFNYNTVLPGTYDFRYFDDSDSNGVWTPGAINPFIPAEWFYYHKDSIDVRSRWETDVGQVD
jgi:hypothetical protein